MSLTEERKEWYDSLERSSLTPPDYTFGIVWPILYLMIIASGGVYFSTPSFTILGAVLYSLQWILNISWSPLFFRFRMLTLSFIVILALVVTTAFTIVEFSNTSPLAALLLVPYMLWITFASYLSGYIWYHNK